ncbi:GNAT family N-acetyltransferase [Gordonia sp. (in: high G+C Gram-positive bacteria)]|uniref:GNAT family N-acetyltransferase n=1 Tax=Gordonia sp. (in: high G+C Gram-positive bacteria) TaxID=84139 RepID=UPI003F967EBA
MTSQSPVTTPLLSSTRVDADRDAITVHRWLSHPKSKYWEMESASVDEVRTFLNDTMRAAAGTDYGLHIGQADGRDEFMFELYDPATSELADPGTGYRHAAGDIGMHLLVAPADQPIAGFTSEVMLYIMRTALFEVGASRVVVEPDVRNASVQALNAAVGFTVVGDYPVGAKTARLSYCTREDFIRVTQNGTVVDPETGVRR